MENLYQILNVSSQATEEEIKKAYRKLAKENHPDVHPDDAARARKFKEVSEAYGILSDPEKRKKYDRELHTAASGQGRTGKQGNKTASRHNMSDIDLQNINMSFESFFGFNPETKEIKNEEKLKTKAENKNPLDASDLFEKFMGIKR